MTRAYCENGHPEWDPTLVNRLDNCLAKHKTVSSRGSGCRICRLVRNEQNSAQKNHPSPGQPDRVSMTNAWHGRDAEGNAWTATPMTIEQVAAIERINRRGTSANIGITEQQQLNLIAHFLAGTWPRPTVTIVRCDFNPEERACARPYLRGEGIATLRHTWGPMLGRTIAVCTLSTASFRHFCNANKLRQRPARSEAMGEDGTRYVFVPNVERARGMAFHERVMVYPPPDDEVILEVDSRIMRTVGLWPSALEVGEPVTFDDTEAP